MANLAGQRLIRLAHQYGSKREIFRFIKYAFVGSMGLFMAMGILWVLVEYLGVLYIIASLIAGEIGITFNFFWYEVWAFRDVKRSFAVSQLVVRWLKFNLVRATGIGISMGILTLLVEIFSVHYFVANIIGTVVAIVFNYIISIGWIWRITRPKE